MQPLELRRGDAEKAGVRALSYQVASGQESPPFIMDGMECRDLLLAIESCSIPPSRSFSLISQRQSDCLATTS
jgi:hypothetical protein